MKSSHLLRQRAELSAYAFGSFILDLGVEVMWPGVDRGWAILLVLSGAAVHTYGMLVIHDSYETFLSVGWQKFFTVLVWLCLAGLVAILFYLLIDNL